jgi:two-component system, chemotaxis family, response regulator Rcp1
MQSSLEILLVEDNEGDVEMTERALRDGEPACRLSVVNNGLEALDFLLKRGGFASAFTPQLILLDLNMPRMDGKKFLEAIKEDSQLKTIPVVMLTSSQSPKDIRDCYERHANCYVVKPFEGKEFISAVRQIVTFWSRLSQFA